MESEHLTSHQEEKLLDYIDGTLSDDERRVVEENLKGSTYLQAKLAELRKLDHALRKIKPVHPSPGFTRSVMHRLTRNPLGYASLRNGILLLSGVIILIIFASILLSTGMFSSTGAIDLTVIGFRDIALPRIPFNGNLVIYVIITLNIAIAFILFDRIVLRPWFERRRDLGY